jgi:hypothetical protein
MSSVSLKVKVSADRATLDRFSKFVQTNYYLSIHLKNTALVIENNINM